MAEMNKYSYFNQFCQRWQLKRQRMAITNVNSCVRDQGKGLKHVSTESLTRVKGTLSKLSKVR